MKKIILSLVAFCICILSSATAIADEIIGYTTYTDVITYINHYAVPSYNFNGTTLIAVEDLRNFGFTVFWNEYKWSLTISRNEYSTVTPLYAFRPALEDLGKAELAITNTDVSVFTGNYQYAAFGGLEGKTLINVEDLRCINGVSVVWVPEINAMKIWVDGLEMLEHPQFVTRNVYYESYDSCRDFNDSWCMWDWWESENYVVLNMAEKISEHSQCYTECYGTLKITDVINADGYSILKYPVSTGYIRPDSYAFLNGFSDYILTKSVVLEKEHLGYNSAPGEGGLIKFTYECDYCEISDSIRVNVLPY